MKKRGMVVYLLVIWFLFAPATHAFNQNDISAKSALLVDMKTQTVLFEKNKDLRVFPASTTKIMTALLVIEHAKMEDIITIPYKPQVGGSTAELIPGERFTVRQLLEALLIKSANNSSVFLAEHVAGTESAFVEMMNQKAQELHCSNTHFTNPHGLHNDWHYTTAADMQKIATAALKYPIFREIVKKDGLVMPVTNKHSRTSYFRSTNRFLWDKNGRITFKNRSIPIFYPEVTGIKTGYTPQAGTCLVSSAKNDHMEVMALVFGSSGLGRFQNSRILLDYGLNYFVIHKEEQVNPETGEVDVQEKLAMNPSADWSTGYVPTVDVRIVREPITVNNQQINNIKRAYPYILYKNVTYLPMTAENTNALGLSIVWDSTSNTFLVDKNENLGGKKIEPRYQAEDNPVFGKAIIPPYTIMVSQKRVDNFMQEYPILNFRGVTYFPLRPQFMNAFGLQHTWTEQQGVDIKKQDPSNNLQN